jgi:hypothetical protein
VRFSCEKCGTIYSAADEKVRGRAFRMSCKLCGHVIVVAPGRPSAASEAPAPAVAPDAALAPEPSPAVATSETSSAAGALEPEAERPQAPRPAPVEDFSAGGQPDAPQARAIDDVFADLPPEARSTTGQIPLVADAIAPTPPPSPEVSSALEITGSTSTQMALPTPPRARRLALLAGLGATALVLAGAAWLGLRSPPAPRAVDRRPAAGVPGLARAAAVPVPALPAPAAVRSERARAEAGEAPAPRSEPRQRPRADPPGAAAPAPRLRAPGPPASQPARAAASVAPTPALASRVPAARTAPQHGFEACVAAARKGEPGVAPNRTVTVTLTVNPDGKVIRSALDDAQLSGTELGKCLEREGAKLRFPAFDGGEPILVHKGVVLP